MTERGFSVGSDLLKMVDGKRLEVVVSKRLEAVVVVSEVCVVLTAVLWC